MYVTENTNGGALLPFLDDDGPPNSRKQLPLTTFQSRIVPSSDPDTISLSDTAARVLIDPV